MTKRIMIIAAVLGAFLSFATSAQALTQPTFDVNPQPGYVGEPITLTDTSNNMPGVVHEWDCDYSGNPAEFSVDQTGSSSSCTYNQSGTAFVAQRVTDGNQSAMFYKGVSVYSQSDKPFDTILASSSTLNVPDTVAFQTPKSQFDVYCYTGSRQCPAFVTGRSGPTASGIYTHYVRVENALAGQDLQLETTASNDSGASQDTKTFTFHVASNANAPLKVLKREMTVCQPSVKRSGQVQIGARMEYYQSGGPDRSSIKVILQKKGTVKGLHDGGKLHWQTVDKQRFSADSGDTSLFSKRLEGLIQIPSSRLRKDPYRVTTKIKTPNDPTQSAVKKKKRLRPAKCDV
jgi:hypothetical protein